MFWWAFGVIIFLILESKELGLISCSYFCLTSTYWKSILWYGFWFRYDGMCCASWKCVVYLLHLVDYVASQEWVVLLFSYHVWCDNLVSHSSSFLFLQQLITARQISFYFFFLDTPNNAPGIDRIGLVGLCQCKCKRCGLTLYWIQGPFGSH